MWSELPLFKDSMVLLFSFFVGVKVVIVTPSLGVVSITKKNWADIVSSLSACCDICFEMKFVRPLYLTEESDLAFLEKYSTLTQAVVSVHCLHFSFDENWLQDSKVGVLSMLDNFSSEDCKLVCYCNTEYALANLFCSSYLHSWNFVVKVNSSSLKLLKDFKMKSLLWLNRRINRAAVTVTLAVLVALVGRTSGTVTVKRVNCLHCVSVYSKKKFFLAFFF